MPTTSNFGWTTPADTDLVKDGAAAIRTLGNGIDTSLVDLKGGTTGQILSKNSNTDLDYTWINNDQGDLTAVQAGVGITVTNGTGPIPTITNSSTDLITTAGDILYGTAADTVARLGIGTAGQVLTVNSGATAPEWATAASGSMTLLETISFAGASSYTSGTLSTSYKSLYIVVRDYDPSTDNTGLNMRVNGISTTSYFHATAYLVTSAFNQTSAEISANLDNTVNNGLAIITIPDYANTDTLKFIESKSLGVNATTTTNMNWRYSFSPVDTTSAITTITFLASSGNIDGGTALIYGVN